MQLETKKIEVFFFRYIMSACIFAMLTTIVIYAYLGTFSRYLADDYCEAVRVQESSPIEAAFSRYTTEVWSTARPSMRYSNLFFVGVSELLGEDNMQITIPVMVLLWVIGLTWSIYEIRKLLEINWRFQMDLFLGVAMGYFSLLQAPNLFQTIYWRSAMMTHFAPLVFGAFLLAFFIKQVKRAEDHYSSLPIQIFMFFTAFIIAGFSEPPATTIITTVLLSILGVSLWEKSPGRSGKLILLVWVLMGAILGLMAMILSPAVSSVVRRSSPDIIRLLFDSFLYSYLFIADSLRTQPLPTFISVFIPLMLIWIYRHTKSSELSREQKCAIWITVAAVPVLAWILIAAGFSPSVYGQSFPVERARFLARTILIASLMLEGALIGLLLGHVQFKKNPALDQWVVAAAFAMVAIIYPIRAAMNIYQFDVPEYRERAEWWDLREAYIVRHAGMGEKDIVIPGFSGVYQVKEIDNNPNHWVNTCAAQYYGVDSIRAVNMSDEHILDYLNE
jgi:hypothetical protein